MDSGKGALFALMVLRGVASPASRCFRGCYLKCADLIAGDSCRVTAEKAKLLRAEADRPRG